MGAHEALLVDELGGVVEGAITNLVVVGEAGALTPALASGGVAGVCRAWLLEAREAVPVPRIGFEALREADEVILTNAVRGPVGVARLVGPRGERIGLPGASGPVARSWAASWQALSRTAGGPWAL